MVSIFSAARRGVERESTDREISIRNHGKGLVLRASLNRTISPTSRALNARGLQSKNPQILPY
jgi:hypothetical protein